MRKLDRSSMAARLDALESKVAQTAGLSPGEIDCAIELFAIDRPTSYRQFRTDHPQFQPDVAAAGYKACHDWRPELFITRPEDIHVSENLDSRKIK